MPQGVHTKSSDAGLVAKLIQVRIVGAVFGRFAGAVVDKDQVPHTQVSGLPRSTIHIFQNLRQQLRFFAGVPFIVARF